MPNWCTNRIKLEGNKNCLNKLKNKIVKLESRSKQGNKTNFMESLIGLGNIPSDYSDQGWYHHNIERFGTKWDFPFSEITLTFEDESIQIDLDTAWKPIIPFLSKLCLKYNVTAINFYFELSENFGGRAYVDNDGRVFNKEYSGIEAFYLFSKEAFWENLEFFMELELIGDSENNPLDSSIFNEKDRKRIESIWNENYKNA